MLTDKNFLEDFNLVEELNNKRSQAISGGAVYGAEEVYFPSGGLAYKVECEPGIEEVAERPYYRMMRNPSGDLESVPDKYCRYIGPPVCDFQQIVHGVQYCCNWDGAGPGSYSCT